MMAPKHLILIANNGDIGGGEVMLLEMARIARNAGIRVEVVAPDEPSEICDAARAEGISVRTFAGDSRLSQARALRKMLRSNTQDVLWCNGLAPSLATTGWTRRIAHIHQLPTWKHIATSRIAGLRAHATIVPSQVMADLLPGSRVLLNWTSAVTVTHRERPAGSPFVLGYLGRITCAKGIDVLFRALQILERQQPGRFRLQMAGDDRFAPPADAATIAAARVPVEHLVDHLGWVDRSDFFASVDLAIFPSTVREPFGLVAAEAMSARVPFVISDSGGLPEVAGPGHPFVATAGDPAALADAIRRAISMREEEPDRFEAMLDDAAARWEQQFSPAAGKVRFLQVLRELGFSVTDAREQ